MIRRAVPALGLAALLCALAWAVALYAAHSLPPAPLRLAAAGRPFLLATPLPPEEKARRLELNSATLEELVALPGIGEKTALAILETREALGGFRYPEDLLLAKGVGAGKLGAIYDLIYVETEESRE